MHSNKSYDKNNSLQNEKIQKLNQINIIQELKKTERLKKIEKHLIKSNFQN